MALPNTIEIKFEAKGDQVLIKTIKSLDEATKSLIKAQSTLAGEGKKQVQSANKHKDALKKLRVQLQLEGKSLKDLNVSLRQYKLALKGDDLALAKLRRTTNKYIQDLKKQKKGLLDTAHSTRILGGSFAVLRSKMLIASFAIMLVQRTVVNMVKTFAKQEAANKKLQVGLANVADTTTGVTQRLIDYSSALQQTTAFGDEMITTGMVQLTTFGLNEEAIKALTPQVLNVARAIQTVSGAMPDLNALFIAFGKSTSTAVSALTRYGVVLTDAEKAQLESMGASTRAMEIANILERQYGGLAEAYAKTTMGMLESAEAARGDAAEAFGEVLAPVVLALSQGLKVMFEAMTPERVKRFGAALGVAAISAGLLKVNLKGAVKAIKAFQIAQIKTGWGAIAAGIGLAAYAAMEYFDVFADQSKVISDAEKRWIEHKEAMLADLEAQKELAKAQEKGAESLRKQLDLLNAKTEVEKMHINLGHQASVVEATYIQKIVDRKQAIEDAKQALKDEEQQIKAVTKALEEEKKVREGLTATIAKTRIALAEEMLRGMELEGEITDDNASKLKNFLDFQKVLLTTFGDRINIEGKLNDLSIEQASIMESLTISLNAENEQQDSLLALLIAIYEQKLLNIGLDKETLSLREQLIGSLTAEQEMLIESSNIWQEKAQIVITSVNNATSAIKTSLDARMNNEIDTLKQTSAYKNADMERRRDMEDRITRAYAGNQKVLFLIAKASSLADVYFNTASAVMKSIAISPLTGGQPWAGIAQVLGGIQAAAILSTPAPQAFAKGGDFVTNKPELIMVGEAGREHVKITPVDRPEERALGSGMTINFNNAVMSEDFTRDQIIPQIKKAVRLNLA